MALFLPYQYHSPIAQNSKKQNMHECKMKRHNKTNLILLFGLFFLELISSIINFLYPLNGQAVLTLLPYNYVPLHFNQWIIGPWTSPTSHSSLHPFFSFQNIILLMSILRVMDNEINLELQQYFANTSSTSLEGVYFYHKNQR